MLTRFTRGPLRGPRAWKQFRSSRARMNRRVKRPFRQSGVGKRTAAAGYTGERRTIAYRGQTTTAYRRGGGTEERLPGARGRRDRARGPGRGGEAEAGLAAARGPGLRSGIAGG